MENRAMRHLLEPYVPAEGYRREDATLFFRFPVPPPDHPLMAQLARNAAAVANMFQLMAEGGAELPRALVEKGLVAAGPRALLAELRRRGNNTRPD